MKIHDSPTHHLRRAGLLDIAVYKLFRWRWNAIFRDNPADLERFIRHLRKLHGEGHHAQ